MEYRLYSRMYIDSSQFFGVVFQYARPIHKYSLMEEAMIFAVADLKTQTHPRPNNQITLYHVNPFSEVGIRKHSLKPSRKYYMPRVATILCYL